MIGVIAHLEERLEDQRAANAAGYDREVALVELRSVALEAAIAQNVADLRPEQLWLAAETPEQLARLRSLVDRAIDTPTTPQEVRS